MVNTDKLGPYIQQLMATAIESEDEFVKEYGTADINIQDGTINYKDEQTDKKN